MIFLKSKLSRKLRLSYLRALKMPTFLQRPAQCFQPKEKLMCIFSSPSIAVGLIKDTDPLYNICLVFGSSDSSGGYLVYPGQTILK